MAVRADFFNANSIADRFQKILDFAKSNIALAQETQEYYMNQSRTEAPRYEVGDSRRRGLAGHQKYRDGETGQKEVVLDKAGEEDMEWHFEKIPDSRINRRTKKLQYVQNSMV